MMFNLTGKKALITGASRGIGRGIALALAKQGADVGVNYHSSQEEAEEVVDQIQSWGQKAIALPADVSSPDEVEAMVERTVENIGGIDILVNNAGIGDTRSLTETSPMEWDKVLETNLKSQFLTAKAVASLMAENNWGRIINMASIVSGGVGVGFAGAAAYGASKGGVVGLTESLALELASDGINVNAIAPGFIETDMTKQIKETEKMNQMIMARTVKGRWGQPKDIGAAAVYLASQEADFVTGTVLYVDGGWLAG